ncbi:sporulation histidine kinase inhibitor Sda [Evansella sp. AB-P1]|nr:sporulation histidine kinase inhibitor Sda [Evansella sp. AB-P1]MDG5789227.1 sporulation histidine kinase inhibitor Sda [Evansella sp. AB-P1]
MHQLSNKLLIDTYERAVKLNLKKDFLRLLEEEIDRRGLRQRRYYNS